MVSCSVPPFKSRCIGSSRRAHGLTPEPKPSRSLGLRVNPWHLAPPGPRNPKPWPKVGRKDPWPFRGLQGPLRQGILGRILGLEGPRIEGP